MSNTESQAYGDFKPGDRVEVVITTTLADVEHWAPSGRNDDHRFTSLTYRSGPDLPSGRQSLWSIELPEVPDEGIDISITRLD